MKHLFKISDIDETIAEVWTLQQLLDILKDRNNDISYSDILLWTKSEIDDKGRKIAELHFGVKDDEDSL